VTQAIDPIKLKAAAEHLEWVLQQYPDNDDVQSLLRSLTPMIEDAKAARVLVPMGDLKIPGAWNFGDGRYIPHKNPSVDEAYVYFSIEMRGGLTAQERQLNARMDAMREAMSEGSEP